MTATPSNVTLSVPPGRPQGTSGPLGVARPLVSLALCVAGGGAMSRGERTAGLR